MNLVQKKKKRHLLFIVDKQKICEHVKKAKKINKKNSVNKMQKKFKLNVDCHIKICKNHNLLEV
jgi:hypothetical protein